MMPVVVVLCLVQFVDVLGVTETTTTLPAMLDDLGAPQSAATPIATGYAMCFGGLLLLGARLGDRLGHRRVLQAGLALFGAASVAVAAAPSVPVLVAGRCGQGMAAALSVPPALRLLSAATEGAARRRALAAWSAAGALAGGSGFVLGGLVTEAAGWRPLFWADVPLALALLVLARRWAPAGDDGRRDRPGVLGALMLTAGVAAVVLGAAGPDVAVLAAGVALLALFALLERRARRPLVAPAGWRHPRLRAGAAASFLNTATTSSALTLAALGLHDPAAAGLGLLPFSVGVVAGSSLAPRLFPARRATAIGLVGIGAGSAVLVAAPVAAGALVAGIGLGVASVGATALGTDVPVALQGAAVGVLNTAAQLGTALGIAALLALAAASSDAVAWLSVAALAAAGAFTLARLPRQRHGQSPVSTA